MSPRLYGLAVLSVLVLSSNTRPLDWQLSAQTGAFPQAAPSVKWRFKTDGYGFSAPSVSRNTVVFGAQDGWVYATTLSQGRLLWKFKAARRVFSTPAIAGNRVYAVGDNNLRSYLYALELKTGHPVWQFEVRGSAKSSPVAREGVVYFSSPDGNLYALEAGTGAIRWKFKGDGPIYASPTLTDGMVYVGTSYGSLYALSLEGKLRWSYQTILNLSSGQGILTPPVVAQGKVYFGDVDKFIYALQADSGQEVWLKYIQGAISASPVVSGGRVLFGSSDGHLYTLSAATGEELWRFDTGLPNRVVTAPAIAGNRVYFGSSDWTLYGLNLQTGREVWRFKTSGDPGKAFDAALTYGTRFNVGIFDPAVQNKTLLFGSSDGYFYALE